MAVGNDQKKVKPRQSCCKVDEYVDGRDVRPVKVFDENDDGISLTPDRGTSSVRASAAQRSGRHPARHLHAPEHVPPIVAPHGEAMSAHVALRISIIRGWRPVNSSNASRMGRWGSALASRSEHLPEPIRHRPSISFRKLSTAVVFPIPGSPVTAIIRPGPLSRVLECPAQRSRVPRRDRPCAASDRRESQPSRGLVMGLCCSRSA